MSLMDENDNSLECIKVYDIANVYTIYYLIDENKTIALPKCNFGNSYSGGDDGWIN